MPIDWNKTLSETISFLKTRKKVLFLTTSNRWKGELESGNKENFPKSTQLALKIAREVGPSVNLLDIARLKIYPCEGNVSSKDGNNCGVDKANLHDPIKNPSGNHRCWASVNNPDDELWQVSKALFESDCVVFFTSVRWGQANGIYQNLIERLTWIENRHSTLNEENVVKDIAAGIIVIGQNWRGANVLETQKNVLDYFGFDVRPELSWNWQYTQNEEDETEYSYQEATKAFADTFLK